MSDLVWEEPPAPIGGGKYRWHKYADVAEQLKAKPGEWARVGEFDRDSRAGTLSQTIRLGRDAFGPRGSFEATVRTIKSGRVGESIVHVFARYIGAPNSS